MAGCFRVGYPRNDLAGQLQASDAEYVAAAKQRMGLPLDRTIVLYAPMFRIGNCGRGKE